MLLKMDRTGKTRSEFICDRCGKLLVSRSDKRYKLAVYTPPKYRKTHESWDLCEECYKEVTEDIEKGSTKKKKTYIYNIKDRTLRSAKNHAASIKLTNYESKLIEVMSNGYLNSWKEMVQYIYGCYDESAQKSLYLLRSRFCKKFNLNIKIMTKQGMKLEDIIYIE